MITVPGSMPNMILALFCKGVLNFTKSFPLNKSTKITVKNLIGIFFFLTLSYVLYRQISTQKDLPARWAEIKDSWHSPAFFAIVLLMFCNWGIEAIKWKYMLQPLQKISFNNSLKGIFAGCAITIITPNRMGEFGGRILFVKPEHRLKAVTISIIGSISQTLITFIIGCFGLLYLHNQTFHFQSNAAEAFIQHPFVLISSLIITLLLGLLFFKENLIWRLIHRIPCIDKWVRTLSISELYTHKNLLIIFLYSFLRYGIFILQYFLMLQVMHIQISPNYFITITAVFFLGMAIAPTFGFIELPVRSELGIAIFGLCTNNLLGLQATTLGIWLINIVIPAVIGLFIILFTKYQSK